MSIEERGKGKVASSTQERTVEERIRVLIEDALTPQKLEIKNDSPQHQGHAGSPNTGASHFTVLIVSNKFEGKTRIERHQMIYQLLAEEMRPEDGIHALSIKAYTPEERS